MMRVESKESRLEMPDGCDNCEYGTKDLERFYTFGPGHNVYWLCPYCLYDHSWGKDITVRTVACMLNALENRIVTRLQQDKIGGE